MRATALAAALVILAAGMAQAEGIGGVFQTQANDNGDIAMVQFGRCGDRWCGTMIKAFHKDGTEFASPNTGRNIVAGMIDRGNGAFDGGTIWDPGADKTYKSRMQLGEGTLKVSGCIGPFCRSQTWRRVK